MSEEKLYAVKNDEGKYLLDSSLSMDYPEWTSDLDGTEIFVERHNAVTASNSSGGHVVTFVEEPKKVDISKEQAEIVEKARVNDIPATYISGHTDVSNVEESLLIKALVNGYTVAKEKKHLVYKELGGKQSELNEKKFAQAYRSLIYPGTISGILTNEVKSGSFAQFAESEIEHYGLQDCEKIWCDSDD